MNDNTKIEVAREIMNALIANEAKKGFDFNNKKLITLLNEENEMNNFNFEVIDKIINQYSILVKRV
ncbi:MAG: hypothetical protein IKI95_07230 [Clostridia bacterium]|nr:hypothetical protein [Clostridia bacterium]